MAVTIFEALRKVERNFGGFDQPSRILWKNRHFTAKYENNRITTHFSGV
ncbi:MAG: hypothetical protein ACXVAC_17745 [Vulcanimicrobiaceae bacterium]